MLEIEKDEKYADILHTEGINGADLLHLKKAYFLMQKIPENTIKLIIQKIDHLKEQTQQPNDMVAQSCSLKPYPFNRYDATYRYTENSILDVTETGPLDLIQPCHEFKAFTKSEGYMKEKYNYEVIRFAAACMNSRTNGTIHFGVEDKPHGQILGVRVPKNDAFADWQKDAIEKHFKLKGKKNVQIAEGEENVQKPDHVKIAKMCIKPPRFVEVLKADMTFSGKYVIEVDIEPSSIVCKDLHFTTIDVNKSEQDKKKKGDESLFIRDGSGSKHIGPNSQEYNNYIDTMRELCQQREDAEEKHLSVVKIHAHGSALCEMITGGTDSMDMPNFTSYIVVANKSHPDQLENLDFLLGLNLVAVLDFDPQSAENGLNNKLLKQNKMFNVHLPAQYEDTGAVEDNASDWFFCNGDIEGETPSDADNWFTEKGSSVRHVVSLLCKKVWPQKKLLVIFLLLSQVSKASDPLLQTFSMFLQELRRQSQILCITDNETSYNHWNDLIKKRHKTDMSKCIYELSFAEINGTILSLWSEIRKSIRFLPSRGGSKVVLPKKTEKSLNMLSILCVNQCEEGHQDIQLFEENFYKGGKVCWWNFYYSEQPGSGLPSVIKRDKLDYIVNTIIPNMSNQKRACVCFNIFHPPGWGGTTLAMHVLWTLKEEFRCAVLKDTTDDLTTAAKQVVQLLTYEAKGKPTRLPVLLMTDHFQDNRNVQTLQDKIEEECLNQSVFSKSPQVIIVNCQRVESCEPTEATVDAVFIPSFLSEKEQKLFEEKLEEFKKNNKNTETFYVSMVAKSFSLSYIQDVVKNTLKDFNFQHKHAQLFAVLVLLNVYSKNALLSVSTCEKFLGVQTKAESRNVEDAFEKFSSLLKRCTDSSSVTSESMSVIHSTVALQCLEELFASHEVTKAQIANLLLTTDLFYENPQQQKFMQNVQDMFWKRKNSAEHEDFSFSTLIQDIKKQTPGMEETVRLNAEKRLREKEAIF
ncbi:sterile alpha motif domain-containing protein 9-like isoform X2 [Labeo rohita]|nr:sterile alpha motif domain-containing protein 9-like isoform X2 [Labeo rohita]